MINAQELWKKRVDSHAKELGRYLRLMFNDHLAIAMFFFLAGLAYVYQQWLSGLSEDFPAALVIAFLFGLLLTYSPVRTLLKEPDLVFLLPAETQLRAFFRNGIIYSYIWQLFTFLFIYVAVIPLYFTAYPARTSSDYAVLGGLIIVFKGWNLMTHWWEINSRVRWSGIVDPLVRFLLNGATLYFIVVGNAWGFAAVTTILLFGVMMFTYLQTKKRNGIAWELLIRKDQSRMQAFYRLANLFTDVPHVKQTIKKRHWLVQLLKKPIPFEQQHTYDYMYRITFIRSSDYLGLYFRLVIIASLLVYFVPTIWLKLAFALLFLFMSGVQMITLWHHHRHLDWLELYPLRIEVRRQALRKWVFQLMTCQTVVVASMFLLLSHWLGFAIMLLLGISFSYGMAYFYLTSRMT
ncbi:ABC transporter permease [Pontibacillus litoralis]|uniref:ABC transporter permease n=1 Tax=Pontibacillus litoralis JSM 072002 TaxID=1385512 RepID=A0A0A5G0Y1_9BACI|nr:ABC transporter permease [Pontibacillus litoralis]KGX84730.1 ABC transporter permease [Pontibacillus litoralis JSM 072002]